MKTSTGFVVQRVVVVVVVVVVVNILRATFVDDDVGCLMIRVGGGL
jgi:hypothetical protein